MAPRFFLFDFFVERPCSGNQLAVVVSDEVLPEDRMQMLAAETNYSETTFVTPLVEKRPATALPSSARTCWSTTSFQHPVRPYALNRATRSGDHRSCSCKPVRWTGTDRCG